MELIRAFDPCNYLTSNKFIKHKNERTKRSQYINFAYFRCLLCKSEKTLLVNIVTMISKASSCFFDDQFAGRNEPTFFTIEEERNTLKVGKMPKIGKHIYLVQCFTTQSKWHYNMTQILSNM